MNDELIDEIADFQKLDGSIKASKLKYREAVIDHYKRLGESRGYSVRENAQVIRNKVNLGRLDLAWLEPNIIFALEFGSTEEIYRHLWKILEVSPSMAALILSSKSGCRPKEINKLIDNSGLLKEKRDIFLIIDISEKKVVRRPSAPRPQPC